MSLHLEYTFDKALEYGMIQDNCQIKFKNKTRKIQFIPIRNLTSLIIGQSETIYFYEKLF